MSNAYGQVYFPSDGLILHFEYQGSSDCVTDPLRESADEVGKHWRQYRFDNQYSCTCGCDEPVEIANDYGGGGWWEGRACRHCRVVTKNRSTYEVDDNEHDGLPQWWVGDRTWADHFKQAKEAVK